MSRLVIMSFSGCNNEYIPHSDNLFHALPGMYAIPLHHKNKLIKTAVFVFGWIIAGIVMQIETTPQQQVFLRPQFRNLDFHNTPHMELYNQLFSELIYMYLPESTNFFYIIMQYLHLKIRSLPDCKQTHLQPPKSTDATRTKG